MKCPKCGNEISITSNYCYYCGEHLWSWEKGNISSAGIDTNTGKLILDIGLVKVTSGEIKFLIDVYRDSSKIVSIESDSINGYTVLNEFKGVVLNQGNYILKILVLRRINENSPWVPVEEYQEETNISQILDLFPTTYHINFYGKIRDKISKNKPVELTWSRNLPLKGYLELFNKSKNDIIDVSIFLHNLEINGNPIKTFYSMFKGKRNNKTDFFGKLGYRDEEIMYGTYTLTHKKSRISRKKEFALRIKIPKRLNPEDKFYIGIDFGTVRTSIGVLLWNNSSIYLPKIGESVYFFPSKFLDFVTDNGAIIDASGNMNEIDLKDSLFPISITEPMGKNESVIRNIKLKIFKNTLLEERRHENNKYKAFISGMWLDYLLHSLLLMWNPDVGTPAPDFFTGKLGGIVLGIPPMWGKEYKRILKEAIKKLLHKLIEQIDENLPIVFIEESWAPIWALPLGELNGFSHVLVWDFGGGTTDIAFYRINESRNPELVAWSEGLLGGTDIDEFLRDKLIEKGIPPQDIDLNYLISMKEKQSKCDGKDEICNRLHEILTNEVPQELEKYIKHLLKDINETYENFTGGNLENENLNLKVLLIGGSSKLRFSKNSKTKNFSVLIKNLIESAWKNVKNLDVQVIGKEKTVEGMLRYYVTMVSSTRDKIITLPKGVLHQDYGCLSASNEIAQTIGKKGQDESILKKLKCAKGQKLVRIINDLYDFDGGKILNKKMGGRGVIGL